MSDPNPLDGTTARALDRYDVPPLSARFADRLVAKALAEEGIAPLPPMTEPRRERRGVWARGRRVVIGVAAFSLMSAGAAATGVFGDAAKNVPVIGPLIAIVAPKPKPKAIVTPKPKSVAPAPALPKLLPPPVVIEEPAIQVAEPTPGEILPPRVRRQIRREFVAQRVVDQIERNEALGIKPTPEQRARFTERLAKLPPSQRLALIKRIRDIRRERQAATTPEGAEAPKPNIPLLDAETRRQLREDRLRLREERRLRQIERAQAEATAPALTETAPPQN
jgi:hypothetical protein